MQNMRFIVFLGIFILANSSQAKLKAMADETLSGVSGQSGLTLDVTSKVNIGELAYFDDNKGLALQGVRLSSATDATKNAEYRFLLDILADGSVSFGFKSGNLARFEVSEIRFVDKPGLVPLAGAKSIGGIFFDFNLDGSVGIQNRGNSKIGVNATLGGVYDVNFSMLNGRLGYRTNGNEFFLDNMSLNVKSMGTVLGATSGLGVKPKGALNLSLPNFLAELKVGAVRFSSNPLNHGVTNDVTSGLALPSYGSFWAKMDLNTDIFIQAGGASGVEGMTINANTTINRLDLGWGDDTDWASSGYWLGALGITGSLSLTNLKADVLNDPDFGVTPAKDYGVGLALAFEKLQANLHIQDFVLGETKTNIDTYLLAANAPVKSIGSLDINLLFQDGIYNARSLTNKVYLQAGGNSNSGYQGLRLDSELSLVSPNNESNFIYTDDGQSLMLSGLAAYIKGDITLDVTRAGNINGTTFYDGLRIGFEDLAFGYKVEGYRVAKSTGNTNDLKSQELQSAHPISGVSGGLTGLSGQPSLEGTLNGHITLGPGGHVGQEGISINADLSVANGTMAKFIQADGSGRGLWLGGLNYDVHLRDMMLDVTSSGLNIYETESWSKLDVTDFRVGGKVTGASFGRLVLETYEMGSNTTISAGGAGAFCIGGVGVDSSNCTAGNGRWDDRGAQGITIAKVHHYKDNVEVDGKRNRFTWETARTGEGTATPVNGTGMQLVFDNFTTNDGDGLTDTFGLQSTYNIDIASAPVIKKTTGLDVNGVNGAKGDEKIMNPDGTYTYKAPSTLTATDIANRPVGLAVRTNTQFKEFDIKNVNLVHPTGGSSTLLYGLKMQNFNITTDITATPLD